MSDQLVVTHCSPTLAGLKTGSLFSYEYLSQSNLKRDVKKLNALLNGKGVYILVLKQEKSRALVYVYRPQQLEKELGKPSVSDFLKQNGYQTNERNYCLSRLKKRLKMQTGFPHEIGLFLGYPLGDVCGFIENQGAHFKCCGYWKVYDNVDLAQKLFQKYKKCTKIYCQKLMEGSSLMRLTVA